MNATILEEILEAKRARVDAAKLATDIASLAERALSHREAEPRRFRSAMVETSRTNVIAEFKRASPSKGVINGSLDPATVARQYENGGAAAISVLTEEDFFQGSLDDLRAVRAATDLPILRKDFIIDEYQIYESAAAGADAILLIVAALPPENLEGFQKLAHNLGMDVLVEIHNKAELETAVAVGADLIGVNNRDLRTFEVSLDVSRSLIVHKPENALMIAESGISNRNEIAELQRLGFDGFLIGESLMRANDAAGKLGEWV